MPLTLVLAIGLDSLSLGIRHSLLQSAGYLVVSAFSLRDAANQFLNGDFDLVLLDNSLPAKDRDRMASLIRVSGSRTPVVSIGSEDSHDDSFIDATFDETPDNLLSGIRSVLIKTAAKANVSGLRNDRKASPGWKKKPSSSGDHQYMRLNTKAS